MADLEVDLMSDAELQTKLAEHGFPIMPITPSTRKLLAKKLKLVLSEKGKSRNTMDFSVSAGRSTRPRAIQEQKPKSMDITPCDPASTQRPLGSGPSGIKLATEGGVGAGIQVPLSAAATGGTSSSSSHATISAVPVPAKQGKWKSKRLAAKEAQAKAVDEGMATSTGGAVLNTGSVGNGRGAIGAPSAQIGTAASGKLSVSPLMHRQRKDRRLKASPLMHRVLTERTEGYPADLSAIAPAAVSTVMNLPVTLNPPLLPLYSGAEGAPPVGAAGNEQSQHWAPPPLVATEPNRNTPRTGSHLPTGNSDTDGARHPKRQRSSEIVSPSSATAEKRPCIQKGGAVLAPGGVKESVEATSSNAASAKSNLKVVIMEKNGVHMDEGRATLVRRHLDLSFAALCREDKYKFEHEAPGFEAMPKPVHGGLSAIAADDHSLEWLATTVASLPPLWPGASGLVVVPQHKLPRYHKGVVFVPNCDESPEDIRQILAWCNNRRLPPLHIDQWPIFAYKRTINDAMTDNVMVFGIPVEELSALAARNHKLKYRLANLHLTVRAPRASDVKTPITTPTAPETPCASTGVPGAVNGGATMGVDADPSTSERELSEEAIDKLLSDVGDELMA